MSTFSYTWFICPMPTFLFGKMLLYAIHTRCASHPCHLQRTPHKLLLQSLIAFTRRHLYSYRVLLLAFFGRKIWLVEFWATWWSTVLLCWCWRVGGFAWKLAVAFLWWCFNNIFGWTKEKNITQIIWCNYIILLWSRALSVSVNLLRDREKERNKKTSRKTNMYCKK